MGFFVCPSLPAESTLNIRCHFEHVPPLHCLPTELHFIEQRLSQTVKYDESEDTANRILHQQVVY